MNEALYFNGAYLKMVRESFLKMSRGKFIIELSTVGVYMTQPRLMKIENSDPKKNKTEVKYSELMGICKVTGKTPSNFMPCA